MMTLKTFETERLLLIPTTVDDAPLFLELLNMPKWLEFIGDRNVHNLIEAQTYIKTKVLPQYERLSYGNYTVIRKADNEKLGCCGLYDREGLDGVDIGFSFLGKFEGNGYAYEAATCLKNAAFNTFKIPNLGAITMESNIASRKLLEKVGLSFTKNIQLESEELMYYELENKGL
jgi:ribosomal-protein-alanine N-acetyltransferase